MTETPITFPDIATLAALANGFIPADERDAAMCDESPTFFRQLRADVCAHYLGEAAVWQRIGFPGGYPDFDQPQL